MTRHWEDIEALALDLTDEALSDLIDALQTALTCRQATCHDGYLPDADSDSLSE